MDLIKRLGQERGYFRPRDVEALGISRNWMSLSWIKMIADVQEIAPGIYAQRRPTYSPVAIAATQTPRGVACLTTALLLHGWQDVPTGQVWWAIPRSVRKPKHPAVPTRYLRLGPATFDQDVVHRSVHGVDIRVYSLARTVADCIRFRDRLRPVLTDPWWQHVQELGQWQHQQRKLARASAQPPPPPPPPPPPRVDSAGFPPVTTLSSVPEGTCPVGANPLMTEKVSSGTVCGASR
jgi:hypothetical protein